MRTGQRSLNRGRAAAVVCAALVAGLTITGAPSSVASPDDPSLEEVKDRVGRLNHQAEQANERYLTLIDQVTKTRKDLKATRKDVREQRAKFNKIKRRVTQSLVADATDSPLGTAGPDACSWPKPSAVHQRVDGRPGVQLDAERHARAVLHDVRRPRDS